jgi:chromosome segregation ATPase
LDESSKIVNDLRAKFVAIDSVLARFAAKHGLRLAVDTVSDVKTAASYATESLDRIATALSLPTADLDRILVSVGNLPGENDKLKAQLTDLTARDAELQAEADALGERAVEMNSRQTERIADLESHRNALAGQLETKTSIIQNYESQVISLRESNEKLRAQPLVRSLLLQVSQVTSENRELQRKLTSAAGEVEDLQITNQKLISTNADLDDRVRELQAENQTLAQTSHVKESLANSLRHENDELCLKLSEAAQTDARVLERQNRRLAAQLQAVETDVARKDAEIARLQRSPRKGELETALARIEAVLDKFQVVQVDGTRPETVIARLEAVLVTILEIADVFQEQERSLSRIAGALPRGITGSPR